MIVVCFRIVAGSGPDPGSKVHLLAAFLRAFDSGDQDEMLRLWDTFIPATVMSDEPNARRLEFYVRVHLAVWPYRSSTASSPESVTVAQKRKQVRAAA